MTGQEMADLVTTSIISGLIEALKMMAPYIIGLIVIYSIILFIKKKFRKK